MAPRDGGRRAARCRRFAPALAFAGRGRRYRVDDLELKVADSKVNASLQVVPGGPRLRITGKMTAPLIDLARRPPASGAAKACAAASASPHPTDHWKLADVDLDLQIARLVFPGGRELRSGSGRLALDNGRLQASKLKATLGGANVSLDGSVADPPNLAGIDMNVALQGNELAELLSFFGTSIPKVGNYQGQATMHGSIDALRLTAIDATAGRPGQRLRASGQIDDVLHWQGLALAITASVSDSQPPAACSVPTCHACRHCMPRRASVARRVATCSTISSSNWAGRRRRDASCSLPASRVRA